MNNSLKPAGQISNGILERYRVRPGRGRALHSYAQRRPLGIRAAGDRSRLVLTVQGSDLTVDFDALGRVANVHGRVGPPG